MFLQFLSSEHELEKKTKPNLWLKGHSQLVNDKTIFMGIKIFELYHTRLHTHKSYI